MALHLDLEPGDSVRIGQSLVTMAHKSGKRARLVIDSEENIQNYKAGDAPPLLNRSERGRKTMQSPHDTPASKPVLKRVPVTR